MHTSESAKSREQPRKPSTYILRSLGKAAVEGNRLRKENHKHVSRFLGHVAQTGRRYAYDPERRATPLVLHDIVTSYAAGADLHYLRVQRMLKNPNDIDLVVPYIRVAAQLNLAQKVFREWPDRVGGELAQMQKDYTESNITYATKNQASYPQIGLLLELETSLAQQTIDTTDPRRATVRDLLSAYGGAIQLPGAQLDARMELLRQTHNVHMSSSL